MPESSTIIRAEKGPGRFTSALAKHSSKYERPSEITNRTIFGVIVMRISKWNKDLHSDLSNSGLLHLDFPGLCTTMNVALHVASLSSTRCLHLLFLGCRSQTLCQAGNQILRARFLALGIGETFPNSIAAYAVAHLPVSNQNQSCSVLDIFGPGCRDAATRWTVLETPNQDRYKSRAAWDLCRLRTAHGAQDSDLN